MVQKSLDKLQLYVFIINAKNNTMTSSCSRRYTLSDDLPSESLLIKHTAERFLLFDFLQAGSEIAINFVIQGG